VLGYFCLFQHLSPANTFSDMFIIWLAVAEWLSGRWRLMFQTPKGIYEVAKRGSLGLTGLALGIERMSLVWLLAAVVTFFR
jgi:protein gp37